MQLAKFIDSLGVSKAAVLFTVSDVTIRSWLNYESVPKPRKAHEIITKSNEVVTWESIYRPFFDTKARKAK